ncbi:MAG: hypothetical protein HQL22_09595 [Candidatus Omnitrophica bacterium]|nr:hypothetical protein [Candidatus Omnitrophota bacterium]
MNLQNLFHNDPRIILGLLLGIMVGAYGQFAFLWASVMCCLAAFLLSKIGRIQRSFLPALAIFLGLCFWNIAGTLLAHQYSFLAINTLFLIPVFWVILSTNKWSIACIILVALSDLIVNVINIAGYVPGSPFHQASVVAIVFRITGLIIAIRYFIFLLKAAHNKDEIYE